VTKRTRYTGPILILMGLLFVQCAILGDGRNRAGSFDLLGFPGDDTVLTAGAEPLIEPDDVDEPRRSYRPADTGQSDTEITYRVQFFATTSLSEAEDMRKRARHELNENVTIDFETPYYKLMIGPLRSEDDAERLVVKLRAMGYDSAWVVRDRSGNQARGQ
jgi:hypothetical protein